MKNLFIDEQECIGCDLCVELCPDLFISNGDLVPRCNNMDVSSSRCARDALAFCPVDAIYIKTI